MLNKMKIMLAGAVVAASMISGAAHADTETATATAEILTPVALSAVTELNFGLVATTGTAGTVNFPAATGARTCTGVICVGTAQTRGSFQVTAAKVGQLVNLSITDNTISLDRVGGGALEATLALSTPSIVFSTTLETVYVGGTLAVEATEIGGVYTGNYEVRADYN